MTCREMMTLEPATCVPGDNVVTAAMLMKSQNVGSIPVLQDRYDRKLLGIVTDRDLALRVVAEQRDYYTTRVSDVMSQDLFTCRVDDDYEDALKAMEKHQVRRVPVVDAEGRLAGIISQADVVRQSPGEPQASRVVAKISEPSDSQRAEAAGIGGITKSTLLMAGGLSVGAGLLYLMDPGWVRKAADQISSLRNSD